MKQKTLVEGGCPKKPLREVTSEGWLKLLDKGDEGWKRRYRQRILD
jgi:hypothetical protein